MSNVTNYTSEIYLKSEIEAAIIAKYAVLFLGIMASLVALILLVGSKSYKRFVYRLVLYLMIINILRAVVEYLEILPIKIHELNKRDDIISIRDGDKWGDLCIMFGYFDLVSSWMLNFIVIWIVFYLLKYVWSLYQLNLGNSPVYHSNSYDKCTNLEVFGILFTLFIFSAIPFWGDKFGVSGPWCWIKVNSDNSCKIDKRELAYVFGLFYGPLIVVIFLIFVILTAITVFLCKGWFSHSGYARLQYSRGTKEMAFTLIFPLLFNALCLVLVVNRIVEAIQVESSDKPVYPLWYAHAIAEPALVLLPPLAFLVHPFAWKNLLFHKQDRPGFEDTDAREHRYSPEGDDIDEPLTTTSRRSSYGSKSVLPTHVRTEEP